MHNNNEEFLQRVERIGDRRGAEQRDSVLLTNKSFKPNNDEH